MPQVSYPGVYIEEFAPAPPIQPAATSVAAFVGFADPMAEDPAPINEPLRITSFSQFQRRFGKSPVSGFYLWYAVRGFFENGGTDCFVVRASNGKPATWTVKNSSGIDIYKVQTKEPVDEFGGFTIEVKDPQRLNWSLGVFMGTYRVVTKLKQDRQTDEEAIDAQLVDLRKTKTLTITNGHLIRPGDRLKADEQSSDKGVRVLRVVPISGSDASDIYLEKALEDLKRTGANADLKIEVFLAPLTRGETEIRLEYPSVKDTSNAKVARKAADDALNALSKLNLKPFLDAVAGLRIEDTDELDALQTKATSAATEAGKAQEAAEKAETQAATCSDAAALVDTTRSDLTQLKKAVEDAKVRVTEKKDSAKSAKDAADIAKTAALAAGDKDAAKPLAVDAIQAASSALEAAKSAIEASIETALRCRSAGIAGSEIEDLVLPDESLVAGALLEIDGKTYAVERVNIEFCNHPDARSRKTYRTILREGLKTEIFRGPASSDSPKVALKESLLIVKKGSKDISKDLISAAAEHPRYAPDVFKGNYLIGLELVSSSGNLAELIPKEVGSVEINDNDKGTNEKPEEFKSTGASLLPSALESLRRISDVNMVAIPDACGLDTVDKKNIVMQAIIAHCETMAERFGILDAHAQDQEMFERKDDKQTIEEQMGASRSTRGYAALYYPWIRTRPAGGGRVLATVPPSGHVCGLLARVDKSRGVHKAPANETLNDAVAITQNMTDQEQGILNLQGINVIRTFSSGGRPTLFGARTTASDKNWQYVNIRRLFLFLEESIATALRSSLFEPNNTELWGKLNRVLTAFLTQQWQEGALFGKKAEEAFYVKIDEELNPFNEQALGKLNIEIGVRPTYPAEFIVVRIGIWDGGMTVSEG
jgi:phage tail sheath protein FI